MICILADMFFASKIQETAKHLGIAIRRIESLSEAEACDAIIADLEKCDAADLIAAAKRSSVIAYASHVDMAKYENYKGSLKIVTKSQLSRELPGILSAIQNNILKT